jgi:hypothetical protein
MPYKDRETRLAYLKQYSKEHGKAYYEKNKEAMHERNRRNYEWRKLKEELPFGLILDEPVRNYAYYNEWRKLKSVLPIGVILDVESREVTKTKKRERRHVRETKILEKGMIDAIEQDRFEKKVVHMINHRKLVC